MDGKFDKKCRHQYQAVEDVRHRNRKPNQGRYHLQLNSATTSWFCKENLIKTFKNCKSSNDKTKVCKTKFEIGKIERCGSTIRNKMACGSNSTHNVFV